MLSKNAKYFLQKYFETFWYYILDKIDERLEKHIKFYIEVLLLVTLNESNNEFKSSYLKNKKYA